MCGLVAIVNKTKNGFSKKQVDSFSQMLYADQLRGSDGTGVFYNSKKNESNVKILKAPYKSSVFIGLKEFIALEEVLFKESNFVVGHNRSATKGKINAACTHPFRENHIILVHNGTLNTHKELHTEYEVDSQAICHSISSIGAEETLKKLNGAFALIWWDMKEKTLNFCRNSQRPLYYIETNTSFVFVSELELGLWILARNGETVVRSVMLTPAMLYSFTLEDMTKYNEKQVSFFPYPQSSGGWFFKDDVWEDGYSANKNPPKKLKFAFGEKIKFKTGDIKGAYVEADIIKYQSIINTKYVIDSDFEHEWRVKIFGTKAYLDTIANKTLAEGVVNHTTSFNTKTLYTVSSVVVLPITVNGGVVDIKSNVSTLPIVFKKKKQRPNLFCEWCSAEVPTLRHIDGFNICTECAATISM